MRVVLAVADSSLGGTSRSALLFSSLWKRAGAEVMIYSPRPLHRRRLESADAEGVRVTTSLDAVRRFQASLVHLHHPAPSRETLAWVNAFMNTMSEDIVVLTHNVFGQALPVDLGQRVVIGVLGGWVGLQYRLQTFCRQSPIRVVANPQDFEFFRPPTPAERQQARKQLGIAPNERVVLRVGSPAEEKWSLRGYASLALVAGSTPRMLLRFIGAPKSFVFDQRGVTTVHEPVADEALRREYWAADVFAHWADRGESFGNVLLEALGTGLPVVYRAVETRDNTPAEFRDIAGFDYVTSAAAWRQHILSSLDVERLPFDSQLIRYSAVTTLDQLRRIVRAGEGVVDPSEILDAVLEALPRPSHSPLCSVAAAGLRHNPLTAFLKRARLRGSTSVSEQISEASL